MILAALSPPAPMPQGKREVVARASSSGGRNWGISLGKYNSQYAAAQVLLKTALMESNTLGESLRKVATRKTGYDALFVGLTRGDADLVCARLAARSVDCSVIGP
jgi:D-alanyl-D-alanine carboxypeptidase